MKSFIIILLGVLVVIGVAIGLLITQVPPAQEGMVEKGVENLFALDSFKHQGKISASLPEGQGAFSLDFQGSLDKSEPENWLSVFELDLAVASQGTELSLSMELRVLEDALYIKIASLPNLGFGSEIDEFLNILVGQWIKVDLDTLKELAGNEGYTDSLALEETKQFLEDLKALLVDKSIFQIENDLGKEEVGSDKANHYLVSIDKEVLKELIPEYVALAAKYAPVEQAALYQEEMDTALEQMPQAIDNAWERIGGISFDAWLTTKGDYLKRLKYNQSFEPADFELTGSGTIDILFDFTFSDFDKEVEILAPSNALPFEELFGGLLTGLDQLVPEELEAEEFNPEDFDWEILDLEE